MGTKKGQKRKTARRAYEKKRIWTPFGRSKPRKDDEMYWYRGVPRQFTKRKGVWGWLR